jgi:AbrB family looped-hinge helix DNA binding protein
MPMVTEKGQVTIPKEYREKLGISSGDEVAFEETDEGLLVRKKTDENPFEKWKGVAETEKPLEEIMTELRGREWPYDQ